MSRIQSFHKETALTIARKMTRDATLSCMKRFDQVVGRDKVSDEETYFLSMGRSVVVECHFDGLRIVIAWYDNNGEKMTPEQAIDLIASNIANINVHERA